MTRVTACPDTRERTPGMDPEAPSTPHVLLTVEEAAVLLGIGRTQMFALIRTRQVESVRIGRLRRIRTAALHDFANRLAAEQNSQTAA